MSVASIFLYIRLSSADSDLKFKTESESITHQRMLLRQYIKTHREFDGYEIIEFCDDGYSGTNANRPSFERMIECLKNGEAHVVICKDFSRFFRDYVEIGDYLERIFPFLGVRFIAVNDGYDSDEYKGSTAGMEVVMKYIVYAYYSRDLSMKQKSAINSRKKKGEFFAAQAPFGYMKDPAVKHRMAINPDTAPIVRRIFELAMEHKSSSEISATLNAERIETPSAYYMRTNPKSDKYRKWTTSGNSWTPTSIRQVLQRREYTGAMVTNKRIWKGLDSPQTLFKDKSEWIVIPDCHEPIVTVEEFEQAQSAVRSNTVTQRTQGNYLLRKLVRCGSCGRIMNRTICKRPYYCCSESKTNPNTKCFVHEKYYMDVLERIVTNDLLEKLHLLMEADMRIREAATAACGTADSIRFRLEQIEKRKKQIELSRVSAYERYADGKLQRDIYLMERDKIAAEADSLIAEKEKLEQELLCLSRSDPYEIKGTADRAQEVLSAEQLTNEMLLTFIDRVNVYSGMRVEIIYRFSDEIARTMEIAQHQ